MTTIEEAVEGTSERVQAEVNRVVPCTELRFGDASRERLRLAWMMGNGMVESGPRLETRFVLDAQGGWFGGDGEWERVTGKAAADSLNTGWVGIVDSSQLGRLHKAYVALIQFGQPFAEEIAIVSQSGGLKPAFLELAKSLHHDGIDGRLTLRDLPIDARLESCRLDDRAVEQFWRRVKQIGMATMIGGVVAACIAMIAVSWIVGQRKVEPQPEIGEISTSISPGEETRQAEEVLRNYHASRSVEDRAQWVANGMAILPQMRAFHQADGMPVCPVDVIQRWDIVLMDGRRHYIAQGTDTENHRFLTLVDISGEEPKVNWEASVGYGEMSMDAFIKSEQTTPVVMRLLARPDDYYNHAFSDAARYACFGLVAREDEPATYAYVERASEAYARLSELFPDYRLASRQNIRTLAPATFDALQVTPKRVTLRLSLHHSDDGPAQVVIKEVLGEEWVVAMNTD